MINLLLLAVAVVSGAPDPAQPEAERRTFIVTLKNGDQHAVFWREAKEVGNIYRVLLDEPWNPDPIIKIPKSEIVGEPKRELAQERENRLRTDCEKDGFKCVNGRYILASEIALAEKAKEWTAARISSSAEPDESTPAEPVVEQTTVPAADANSAGYWGAIATIVLMAAALITVVAKTMLTNDDV